MTERIDVSITRRAHSARVSVTLSLFVENHCLSTLTSSVPVGSLPLCTDDVARLVEAVRSICKNRYESLPLF